jgi:hypothetical protein
MHQPAPDMHQFTHGVFEFNCGQETGQGKFAFKIINRKNNGL